jgi:CHAT domain-containing protein
MRAALIKFTQDQLRALPLTHTFCTLLLALGLCWGAPIKAAFRPQTAEEAALRTLAEQFFNNWAAKDLDGFLRLWSAQSPELTAREKATRELFAASAKLEVSQLRVRKVQLEGTQASLHIELTALVTDAKTGQPRAGYGNMLRTLHCVKESESWKVWRELATADDFAARLAAATAQERDALLRQEPELQSTELQRALLRQGGRFNQQQKFDQAIEMFQRAQTLAEKLNDHTGMALALRNIGFAYGVQEKYRQAFAYFEKMLALLDALSRPGQAEFLRNLGVLQHALGDYPAALNSTQRAVTIFEELPNREDIAGTLNNVAVIYRSLGEYEQALEIYQKGLKLLTESQDLLGITRLRLNLGVVHSQRGDFSRALENFQQALKLYESLPDPRTTDIADTWYNIGTVYLEQGDPQQALDFYQRAQAVLEKAGKKETLANLYIQAGHAYEDLGDAARALVNYRQAQALFETLENKAGLAGTYLSIGNLELARRAYAPALEYFQKSLALYEALGDSYGLASALGRLGAMQYERGDYEQSLNLLARATPVAEKIGSLQLLGELYDWTGKTQFARGQEETARAAFEKAIAATEALRQQTVGGEQERQHLLETKLEPWHGLVRLLVKKQQAREALAFVEQSKARVLLDVLQRGRLDIRKAMTAAEQAQERQLRAALTSLNTQVTRVKQTNKPELATLAELEPRLNQARLAYEAFQTSLYAAHPELRLERGEAPTLQIEELSAWPPVPGLHTQSAVLEYMITQMATYLFVLTPNARHTATDVHVFTIPIKQTELVSQIEGFRRQLANGDLGFRGAAAKLYDLLLKPAQAQLKGKTNLVIVPDGKLWELPFQALLTAPQRFLLEDAAITYAPSLTVLREMTKRTSAPAQMAGELLALGNPLLGQAAIERATLTLRGEKLAPLPEAEAEVKALGQLYGATRSKVYIGAEAREDRAKAEATRARVLHFATHGVLNNAAPLYSHLVLTQQNPVTGNLPTGNLEDGLLEAWELMQLDLHADLAVLSACETARGRFGAGEGMIGLTWALFVAGVPATVVSQWQVESAATRDLMVAFHRQWRATGASSATGKTTKAAALRQAALSLLKKTATSHPFYWAGFVLVGDGR